MAIQHSLQFEFPDPLTAASLLLAVLRSSKEDAARKHRADHPDRNAARVF
jgi:hypothetical protein